MEEPDEKRESPDKRRAYKKPQLQCYGRLCKLTQEVGNHGAQDNEHSSIKTGV